MIFTMKKNRLIRRLLFSVLVIIMIALIAGCHMVVSTEKDKDPEFGYKESIVTGAIQINIYHADSFPVPDGTALNTMISPEWNGEALCFTADYYENVIDVNGGKTVLHRLMLVTADCDEVLSQTPITLPDDGGSHGDASGTEH